jgi:protein ImuB
LVPVDLPLVFEEAVELEHPLVLLEPLAFLLNRLLEQLCSRLSARALAAEEIRLKFELDATYCSDHYGSTGANGSSANPHSVIPSARMSETNEPRDPASCAACSKPESRNAKPSFFTRTLRLPLPMLDAKIFLKLLQLDLQAHPPGAPITKIWLSAQPARLRPGQAGLFVPPSPEPEKLELTMARISGIVGEGNAGSVELLDTHHPEGFRMRHFTPRDVTREKKPRVKKPQPSTDAHNNLTQGLSAREQARDLEPKPERRHSPEPVVTALRLFRPPQLATVTMRDGNPARIACSSDKVIDGDILWRAGPWRSSGDWWEQEPWARDEWDVAIPASTGLVLYRLVHDLFSGTWFVEGIYD